MQSLILKLQAEVEARKHPRLELTPVLRTVLGIAAVGVAAFLLGGGLALSAHGTKAGARAAINLSPEPASNIVVSLTEDVIAVGSVLLSVFAPLALIGLIVVFLIISFLMLRRIISAMKAMMLRIRSVFT